ncbi:MAG: methyl-accepting chemotaxis protein [Spirochaetia bacterium]
MHTRLIKLQIAIINIIFPAIFVQLNQMILQAFNPHISGNFAFRMAFSVKPAIYSIFALCAVTAAAVVLIMVNPVFRYLRNGELAEKARVATIRVPWFLLILHISLWFVGTTVFYAMYGFQSPGGIPYTWSLLSHMASGLLGALFTILVLNNILLPAKDELKITSIQHKENDSFSRRKDLIIFLSSLFTFALYVGFCGRYFMLAQNDSEFMPPYGMTILLLSILLGVICFSLHWLTKYQYYYQIRSLKKTLSMLGEGKADLSYRLIIINFDELGDICAEINSFMDYLAGMIRRVREVSAVTENSSNTVSSKLKENEDYIAGCRDAMQQITQSLSYENTELGRAQERVESISSNIGKYVDQILSQAGNIDDTLLQVGKMVDGFYQISDSTSSTKALSDELTEETEKAVSELSRFNKAVEKINNASQQVLGIVNEISDIAELTSILSLNASIEAAHAGEAGKGFSVVAGEVRSLSGRTSQSVKTAVDQISDMRNTTNDGMEVVTALEKAFQETLGKIGLIEDSIAKITEDMNELTSMSSGIKNSMEELGNSANSMRDLSKEQRESSKEIALVVEHIRDTAERTQKAADTMEEKIEKLLNNNKDIHKLSSENTTRTSQLKSLTSKFRL